MRALAAHPGWSSTGLQGGSGSRLADRLTAARTRADAQNAAEGARPTLLAATADLPGGSSTGPSGPGEVRGAPRLVGRSAVAGDLEPADRLWALSARLTGSDALEDAAAR